MMNEQIAGMLMNNAGNPQMVSNIANQYGVSQQEIAQTLNIPTESAARYVNSGQSNAGQSNTEANANIPQNPASFNTEVGGSRGGNYNNMAGFANTEVGGNMNGGASPMGEQRALGGGYNMGGEGQPYRMGEGQAYPMMEDRGIDEVGAGNFYNINPTEYGANKPTTEYGGKLPAQTENREAQPATFPRSPSGLSFESAPNMNTAATGPRPLPAANAAPATNTAAPAPVSNAVAAPRPAAPRPAAPLNAMNPSRPAAPRSAAPGARAGFRSAQANLTGGNLGANQAFTAGFNRVRGQR